MFQNAVSLKLLTLGLSLCAVFLTICKCHRTAGPLFVRGLIDSAWTKHEDRRRLHSAFSATQPYQPFMVCPVSGLFAFWGLSTFLRPTPGPVHHPTAILHDPCFSFRCAYRALPRIAAMACAANKSDVTILLQYPGLQYPYCARLRSARQPLTRCRQAALRSRAAR